MPEPLGLEKPPGYLMLVAAQNVRTRAARRLHRHHLGRRRERQHRRRAQARDRGGPGRGPAPAGRRASASTPPATTTTPGSTGGGSATSARSASATAPTSSARRCAQEIKKGVEIIKIFASGGHGVADESGTRGFARDELRAILDAAHDRGAPRARPLRVARPDPRVRARGRGHHRPRRPDGRRVPRGDAGARHLPVPRALLREAAARLRGRGPDRDARADRDRAARVRPRLSHDPARERRRRAAAWSATTTACSRCPTATTPRSSSST